MENCIPTPEINKDRIFALARELYASHWVVNQFAGQSIQLSPAAAGLIGNWKALWPEIMAKLNSLGAIAETGKDDFGGFGPVVSIVDEKGKKTVIPYDSGRLLSEQMINIVVGANTPQ